LSEEPEKSYVFLICGRIEQFANHPSSRPRLFAAINQFGQRSGEIVTLALRHAHMTRRRHAHLPFKSNLAFKKHFSA